MGEIKFKAVPLADNYMSFRLRLTLLTDMLGTKPCSADIAQRFLQAKMNKADRMARDLTEEDRIAQANEDVETAQKALTIFYKDENGNPMIQGYQIIGALKEAAERQHSDTRKCASHFFAGSIAKKVEQTFSIPENFIRVSLPDGYDPYETIEVDGESVKRWKQFERPLRTTFKGITKTSLTRSEIIPAGSVIECSINILTKTVPVGSKKEAVKVDAEKFLMELLGELPKQGLGQFRNGGYGRAQAEIAEIAEV